MSRALRFLSALASSVLLVALALLIVVAGILGGLFFLCRADLASAAEVLAIAFGAARAVLIECIPDLWRRQ